MQFQSGFGGAKTVGTQGEIKEKTRSKVKEPKRYNVIMHNDDFTTMEFVVEVLVDIFHMDTVTADRIMMTVHKRGKAVIGSYTYDVAASRVNAALARARRQNFPFRMTIEQA